MLNPFPQLLDFALFAPLILRLAAGLIMIGFGKEHLKRESNWKSFFDVIGLRPAGLYIGIIGTLEIIAGVMLVAGLGTQLAAIFASVIVAAATVIESKNDRLLKRDLVFYILLLCVCLSLILSGAGIPALDLPL